MKKIYAMLLAAIAIVLVPNTVLAATGGDGFQNESHAVSINSIEEGEINIGILWGELSFNYVQVGTDEYEWQDAVAVTEEDPRFSSTNYVIVSNGSYYDDINVNLSWTSTIEEVSALFDITVSNYGCKAITNTEADWTIENAVTQYFSDSACSIGLADGTNVAQDETVYGWTLIETSDLSNVESDTDTLVLNHNLTGAFTSDATYYVKLTGGTKDAVQTCLDGDKIIGSLTVAITY